MSKFSVLSRAWLVGVFAAAALSLQAAQNLYIGYWELTIPGGGAGWLGVEEKDGKLQASILWGGGSVVPTDSAEVRDGVLVVTRKHNIERKEGGKTIKKTLLETITAKAEGDKLQAVTAKQREDGSGEDRALFSGKRTPPMPPKPDLSKVKFGDPIELFNGKNLDGWKLIEQGAVNGWSAKGGLLVNSAVQEEGKPHKNYGNLRTEKEFEDFNLKLEARVQKGGNSGVYLRGVYEIQVADSHGRPANSHGMGGVYSRITPTSNPTKPAGEWQTMDLTLIDRHITVVLNGQKIIDNQPVLGCTGGALTSDVTRPGPIYLQGDHASVEYRNLVLRPVVK